MTCLNLFATKIDQVMGILEQRAPSIPSILVDTPGQIECFVWFVPCAPLRPLFSPPLIFVGPLLEPLLPTP